jgi:phage recombination protein Bet
MSKKTETPVEAPETEKPTTEPEQPASEEKDKKDIQAIATVIENKAIAPQDAFGKLTRGQIDLIKRTVAKGASDDELKLFIQICKGSNLNPFLRQAHLVPFWDGKEGVERRVILIGIDGYRAIAEESGQYAGSDDAVCEGETELAYEYTEYVNNKKQTKQETKIVPAKATVTVYKVIGGLRCPFTASARWDEYYPGGKKGGQWHKMPYLMLGKCAEALALRKAFPKLLSGMYVAEEMDQAQSEGAPEARTQRGLQTLISALKKADKPALEAYLEKMESSDKYTPAQKAEFKAKVNERLAELEK